MSGSRSGFSIQITAVDAASKQIDQINRRIRAMQAPSERLTKAFGRLADTTGITALNRGMRNLARESLLAFENLSRMAGPMGAITGAATIVGLVKLTSTWAQYGTQLGLASVRTGDGVEHLNAMQGAARLAGASADALTSAMRSLKDNTFEINAGRALPMTMVAFNTLGISVNDAAGHMKTAARLLPEVADALVKVKDPTQQMTLATLTLGAAAEELAPYWRKGAAGIAEYNEKARSYGVFNEKAAAAANDLREKQAELMLSTQGLGWSIAEGLAPVMGDLELSLAHWIRDNRTLIATNISGWASDYGSVLGGIGHGIDKVVTSTIGWNNAIGIGGPLAIGLLFPPLRRLEAWLLRIAAMKAPWLLPLALVGGAGGEDEKFSEQKNQEYLRDHPRHGGATAPPGSGTYDKTLSPEARGLLDRIAQTESGGRYDVEYGGARFNDFSRHPNIPNMIKTGPNAGKYSTAAGRYQFKKDTWDEAAAALGLPDFSPTSQDQAAWWLAQKEYNTRTNRTLADDVKSPDPVIRANIPRVLHGRWTSLPGGIEQAPPHTGPYATKGNRGMADPANPGYDKNGVPLSFGQPANVQGGSGAGPGPQSTNTLRGSANLSIKLAGFPPGTKTTATTDGGIWDTSPPRIEHAMAPA